MTSAHTVSEYSSFVVTGVRLNGQRFTITTTNYRYASAINVWRGSLWGVRVDTGRRQLITRYT